MKHSVVKLSFVVTICISASLSSARGEEILWRGSTSANWHTAANWAGGVVPTAADIAVFDPVTQPITRWNFRMGANAAVSGIRFTNLTQTVTGDASGDFSLSIGSNGVSVAGADVTLAVACSLAADQRWSVAAGTELIHSGQMRGGAQLTKSGAGRVWLTGDSVFTGEYRIEQGILKGAVFTAPVMDGLEVWMDAAAADTIVTNASGQVTLWTDRVGGATMTPVGAGGGPLYGATLLNGRPGLRFDRTLNNGLLMTSGYANTTNVATAFVMMQRRSAQTPYAGLLSLYKEGSMDYNNISSAAFYHFFGAAPFYAITGYRNNVGGGQIPLTRETPICLMSRFNGSSHTLVQDGDIPGSVSTDARMYDTFNADRLILGNRPVANYAYPFNGDVAEVLVYNRVLTAAEEQQVTEYLRARWKPSESLDDVLKDAALWFDASDTGSITTNALGGVTAWANRLSESSLVPLSSTTNAPAYVAVNANGVPAVRFNRDIPNYLQNNGGYHNRGGALTLFVSLTPREVQSAAAGVASVVGAGDDHNATAHAVLMYLRDQTTGQQWSGHRAAAGLSYSYTTPDLPAVAMSRYDGTEHTLVVNGDTTGIAFASQGNFNASNFRLGDRIESVRRIFNGDIHEVLVFNRRLTPSEERVVADYLEAKWVATADIDELLAYADLHLDASAAASILTNATGSVTNWVNLAGSSVMTVPTNGYSGPLLVPGAMNGRPALRFSPSGNTALFMEQGYTNTGAQVNAFIVMRRNADQVQYAGLLSIYASSTTQDSNIGGNAIMAYYPDNETIAGYRANGLRAAVTDIPYNAPVCLHTAFNGLAHTLALNNGAVASSAYLGKLNADRLCLGVRYESSSFIRHFSGDVAEILIYNRMLSPAEKRLITEHLTDKWLPATAANDLEAILQSATLWLDASDAATLVTDGNAQVTAWSNRLDNAAKALLPPAGQKGPTVLADGMNGRPVLRFDKDAVVKQALMIDSGFALTGPATTAVIMMRTRPTQIANARLATLWKDSGEDHNSVDGGIYGYFFSATTLRGHRVGGAKSQFSGLPVETPLCIFSRYDGSRHRMIKDEQLCAPVASTGEFNANRFALSYRVGVNEWFNGDIAEVIVFNYALNPDQQRILYAYMQTKWVKPESGGTLEGSQLIVVNSGAELDVRDIGGLTVQEGARLSGAGSVAGDVAVAPGGTIAATVEGTDNTLAITGDLTVESGSTIEMDYLDGAPLITAGGLLRLPAGITFAVTNLIESNRGGRLPVLRGGLWDDGSGGMPSATAWILEGATGGTTFVLDESDFSVNLQVLRGTVIMVR